MKKELYITNLSFQSTEEELFDVFSAVGKVENIRIIIDKTTGRSRGYAFVEMENEELAKECIEKLDSVHVGGRSIKVSFANAKKKRN